MELVESADDLINRAMFSYPAALVSNLGKTIIENSEEPLKVVNMHTAVCCHGILEDKNSVGVTIHLFNNNLNINIHYAVNDLIANSHQEITKKILSYLNEN